MYKKISILALLFAGSDALAQELCCSPQDSPFYARVEVGGSFSQCTKFCVDDTFWDPAREGYNNKLGKVPLWGAALGYHVNSWLALGFSVAHRSNFKYCKFQTALTDATTPNNLGNKTRIFNFDNTSFMFDLFFNRSGYDSCYALRWCNTSWIPYLGVSVGMSKNQLYNFHSVKTATLTSGSFTGKQVASIMTPITHNKIAGQAQIGVDVYINSCLALGIGYRYFDGGRLLTNNYIIDTSSDLPTPVTCPAWRGRFRAHEVVGSFTLDF